jgi:hypothetical protein
MLNLREMNRKNRRIKSRRDNTLIGLGVFDCIARELVDPDTGEIYPALSCCNDQTMADRCTVPGAARVIWSIKASAALNSDCAVLLREGFKSGRIRLLANEYDAERFLEDLKKYNSLNPPEKVALQMPYIHTTLLIDELVNLQHDESNGRVRIYEKSGMRKDRYSSLSYNYYVAIQLESKLTRRKNNGLLDDTKFIIKPPSHSGKAVRTSSGKRSGPKWY